MVAEILLLFRFKVTFHRSFSTRKATSIRNCSHTNDETTSTKLLLSLKSLVQDPQSTAPTGATAAKCCEKQPGTGLVRVPGRASYTETPVKFIIAFLAYSNIHLSCVCLPP